MITVILRNRNIPQDNVFCMYVSVFAENADVYAESICNFLLRMVKQ